MSIHKIAQSEEGSRQRTNLWRKPAFEGQEEDEEGRHGADKKLEGEAGEASVPEPKRTKLFQEKKNGRVKDTVWLRMRRADVGTEDSVDPFKSNFSGVLEREE